MSDRSYNKAAKVGGVHLITSKQAIKACLLAQALSNGYKPIQLFRYDSQEKYL
jgi:hypothetical protein